MAESGVIVESGVVAESGWAAESGVVGPNVGFTVSVSRSPLSLIFRFGLLAHLDGGPIETSKPGDRTEDEPGHGQPAVGPQLLVQPPASEKAQQNRQDKVKTDRSVVPEPLEIASQDFRPRGSPLPNAKDSLLLPTSSEKPRLRPMPQ